MKENVQAGSMTRAEEKVKKSGSLSGDWLISAQKPACPGQEKFPTSIKIGQKKDAQGSVKPAELHKEGHAETQGDAVDILFILQIGRSFRFYRHNQEKERQRSFKKKENRPRSKKEKMRKEKSTQKGENDALLAVAREDVTGKRQSEKHGAAHAAGHDRQTRRKIHAPPTRIISCQAEEKGPQGGRIEKRSGSGSKRALKNFCDSAEGEKKPPRLGGVKKQKENKTRDQPVFYARRSNRSERLKEPKNEIPGQKNSRPVLEMSRPESGIETAPGKNCGQGKENEKNDEEMNWEDGFHVLSIANKVPGFPSKNPLSALSASQPVKRNNSLKTQGGILLYNKRIIL